MAPTLRSLSKQERFCNDSLDNLIKLVDDYNEQRDKFLLEGWKQHANTLFTDFRSIRLQTEVLLDQEKPEVPDPKTDDDADYREILAKFESKYLQMYSKIAAELQKLDKVKLTSTKHVAKKSDVSPDPTFSRIKLPEVKLPTFDGSITNWLHFRDTFVSLTDSNPQLKPIDKFTYLISSLSKEAKRVIESIEISSANYSVAWGLLEKLFDNKKLIVKSYIESLLTNEPMRKESFESLFRIIDDFERNLNMMVETSGWSVLLVCARLDDATLRQWEQHHKSSEVPTYEELIKFLREYCSILQSLSSSKPRPPEPAKPDPVRLLKPKLSHAVTTAEPKRCPFCRQPPHSFFHCEIFRNMPVAQRLEAVKRK